MFDVNQLYNFSLPMTVANTPHGNLRDMSGMDIRDVRLVQVIHGGLTNWLLRPFAHGRFVTWEGFRTRTEALLWSTCSKLLRRSQSLNLLTLEKDLANTMGLNIDDFNQRIKVHDHLANLVLQFLQQHHTSPTTTTLASLVKWANHPSRLNGNKSLDSMATQLLQAKQRMPKGDAPTLGAMAAAWGLEPGYLTKLTEKALSHLIVTARPLCG